MTEVLRFIRVPEPVAERHRLKAERGRAAKANYRATHKYKKPVKDRPFIVWDGEGPQDTGYSLLGNSRGDEICYPTLKTSDCLNLFLESAEKYPDAIHVGFGFNYDVSCILWELSWRHLTALYKFNRTVWREYTIEHIPRKWFTIQRGEAKITIYDVQSFFATSLVVALEKWSIGPWNVKTTGVTSITTSPQSVPTLTYVSQMTERELVETFKKLRSEFLWKDIEQIRIYMRLELKYTVILMNRLREAFAAAGYIPRSWHGPGAIARMAFTKHRVYDSMAECPPEVKEAARFAFIAGRFELFQAGHTGRVYSADINSAYPYYCSQLPNLARGTWRQTRKYEPGKFGVYRIHFEAKPDPYDIYPLPNRTKKGMIIWPHRTEGWYWNPEAELVADDSRAEFLDGWVFDEEDPTDRPFAWLRDYYEIRKKLKNEGNPAEYTFKLIINSVYGQLAQRTGWDKKNNRPPKTHQLEFAGWITSSCRAAVYKVGKRCGKNLVSIDTDGVTSTAPFTWLEHSKELGGWELSEYDDSIYWQSGIYTLKEGDEWTKAKTRGIPKGSYSVTDLFTSLQDGTPLRLIKKVFTSYGLAINGQRQNLNTWKEEPHVYEFGGNGKRYHYKGSPRISGGCVRVCPGNGVHRLALPTVLFPPFADCTSRPHRLPWLDSEKDMERKQFLTDLVFYDRNDLDPDDEWVRDYGEQ